jgi:hypothetical protein
MKNLIRTLARVRHAVIGSIGMGAIAASAGLIQANVLLMYAGICWIFVSVAALILTHVVDRGMAEMTFRVEGVVIEQQPQLTDVQAHMRPAAELPRVA